MDVTSFLKTVENRKIEEYVEYLTVVVKSLFSKPQKVVLFRNKRHNSRHEDEFHSEKEIGIVVECLVEGGVERKKIIITEHTGRESHEEADKDNYWVVSDRHYKIRAPFFRAKYVLIQFPIITQ